MKLKCNYQLNCLPSFALHGAVNKIGNVLYCIVLIEANNFFALQQLDGIGYWVEKKERYAIHGPVAIKKGWNASQRW